MQIHWKRKKVIRRITDHVEISCDDSDEEYIKLEMVIIFF